MLALVAGCGDAPQRGGSDTNIQAEVRQDPDWAAIWSSLHMPPGMARAEPAGVALAGVRRASDPLSDLPPYLEFAERVTQWRLGYWAYNGPPEFERHFVEDVIPCESKWQIDPGNPMYLGLMQWLPDSWSRAAGRTGLTDWRDPFAQGANTAVWVRLTVPGEQWPTCWRVNQ